MSDTPGPPSTPAPPSPPGEPAAWPAAPVTPPPPPPPDRRRGRDEPGRHRWRRIWIRAGVVGLVVVLMAFVGSGRDPDEADVSEAVRWGAPATEAPPTEFPRGEPGSRDDPLAVGDTASLSEWEVRIDDIDLDATQEVVAASDEQQPRYGRYGLVTLTATYTGDDEVDPALQLGVTLVGADSRHYPDAYCLGRGPDSILDQPVVEDGGTVTGEVCLDFPDEAIDDGVVLFVDETLVRDGLRAWWAAPLS